MRSIQISASATVYEPTVRRVTTSNPDDGQRPTPTSAEKKISVGSKSPAIVSACATLTDVGVQRTPLTIASGRQRIARSCASRRGVASAHPRWCGVGIGTTTIVVVEHIIDASTALADDLVVLAGGRVLARGAPAEVLRDERVVEAYLGEPLDAAA